jgi:hypothetical protein
MIAWATIVNAVMLGAALLWLASLTLLPGRAIRARNAWLLRRGSTADFMWDPATVPADFRVERGPVPPVIVEAIAAAGLNGIASDWHRALALVGMLVRHARREGAVRADLATTYRAILEGTGYCADYVRVFLAAAASSNLFCRQWAFSFDGFGGHGHTFLEVYDRERSHWSFIDVHNNVYAVRAGTHTPLDALALRIALLERPADIEFRPAAPGRPGYPHAEKLLDYYRRGAREWYLWWGNDIAERERRGIARLLSHVSGRLAYRLGSGVAYLPALVVLVTPHNEQAVARMERLGRDVRRAVSLVVLLTAMLLLLAAWTVYATRRGE